MSYEYEGLTDAKNLRYGDIIYLDGKRGIYVQNVRTEGTKFIVTLRNNEVKEFNFNEKIHYK